MIDVKLKNISESKEYLGARSLSIKFGSITVTTPTRVLSSSDIRRKRNVPTQIPLTNEVVLLDMPISPEALVSPSRESNNRIKNVIKRLESFYGDLHKIHYLIPFIYPRGKGRERILHSRKLVEKTLTSIIMMTNPIIEADYYFDTVCIYPFMLGFSDYIDVIKEIIKLFDKYNQTIIPIIDIAHNNFSQLVKKFVDDYDIKIIGVKYRKISNYLSNYAFLYNEYWDKDIAFLLVDVKRRIRLGVKDFALPHYMPMFGFDLIIPELSHGRYTTNISFKFRLLDRPNLRLPLIHDIKEERRRTLLEELNVDLDYGILGNMVKILIDQDLFEQTKEKIHARIKSDVSTLKREAYEMYMRLYSLTRLQEVKASTNEFSYLKKFIIKNDIEEYYNSRANLKTVVKKISVYKFKRRINDLL